MGAVTTTWAREERDPREETADGSVAPREARAKERAERAPREDIATATEALAMDMEEKVARDPREVITDTAALITTEEREERDLREDLAAMDTLPDTVTTTEPTTTEERDPREVTTTETRS